MTDLITMLYNTVFGFSWIQTQFEPQNQLNKLFTSIFDLRNKLLPSESDMYNEVSSARYNMFLEVACLISFT